MEDLTGENSVFRHLSARLRTSSAVVPALLAALISMPIGAGGLAFGPKEFSLVFLIVLIAPLTVLLGQIVLFSIFDRDRLHNEEHLERRMVIERTPAEIGDAKSVVILENKAVQLTENPSMEGSKNV